ncbi:MAG: caspase family protein [Pseudomonadota bacterium]
MMQRRDVLAGAFASAVGQAFARPLVAAPSLPKHDDGRWAEGEALALCVGMDNYAHLDVLRTPLADSFAVAKSLLRLGFDVRYLQNPNFEDFLLGLAVFRTLSAKAKTTVIYVAGHGGFAQDELHILPVDATVDVQQMATIPESTLLQAVSDKPRQKIFLLDCCRSRLAEAQIGKTSSRNPTAGLYTLYAAQPDAPAFEGEGELGPFADGLRRALLMPGLEIEEVARQTRAHVLLRTQGAQIPWSHSSLLTRVILNPAPL